MDTKQLSEEQKTSKSFFVFISVDFHLMISNSILNNDLFGAFAPNIDLETIAPHIIHNQH